MLTNQKKDSSDVNQEALTTIPAIDEQLAQKLEEQWKPQALTDGGPLPSDPDAPTTLPQVLERSAEQIVGESIVYLQGDGSEIVQSYAELLEEAKKILAGLRKQGLTPQDKVILQLEKSWDIIPAFWGCILGGFVPTIMEAPITYVESNPIAKKLRQIWEFLDKPFIITNKELPEKIHSFLSGSEQKVSCIETLRHNAPDKSYYPSQPEETAFFNLTSGSTGIPKCVRLTHRNLISRSRGANILNHHQPEDVILNWLPFDHIGSICDWHIRCIELGCKQVYAAKEYILGRPLNWLDLIDKYRVNYSWAPNFAYSLVNDLLEREPNQTWDLSCVQFLLTAGEAVSSQAVEEFMENMAAYGLSKTAIRPAFGMAELGSGITYYQPTAEAPLKFHRVDKDSLKGTIKRVGAEHPNSSIFADLGPVIPGVTIRIVDEEKSILPEDTIGHLQVSGDAVSPGYDKNPEANRASFLENGWFDTGDLGFITNGHLVLTGRAKETIIINGANYYSQEIETVVEEVEGVEVSYTAACAVRDGGGSTEKLAIFFHLTTQKDEEILPLLQRIRKQVISKIGVNPDYLIPVPREVIPKTAIGKIQRLKLSKGFEAGEFTQILKQLGDQNARSSKEKIAPRNKLEHQLASIWQDVLGIPTVGIEDNFFELGGNSIVAMAMVNKLQDELNKILHPVALFDAPTIATLAEYLEENYSELAEETEGKVVSKTSNTLVEKLNTKQIGQMRQYLLHHLCGESVQSDTSGKKNKQAIFILCTGRSGSTLLRVIMAGHPQLFAPPELYLLSFNTLAERKAAFSGRNNFLGEGVIRAIMEIKNCDGEQAQQIMEELEEQNLSTKEFFSLMQEWLPGQIIADKTPPYVFNPEVLQRAEEEFENPLYIHLQRHPLATIRSMKEARLDLLVAMEENQFSVEQKGELMWLISHQNILEFLKNIPSSRQHQLKYEDLVQQPETTVDQLCEFIGIDFHPDMLQPYKEKKQRMTDGVHAVSRMMGDPKFHTYKGINAKVAERWKEEYKVDFLSPETWKVAESLGYDRPSENSLSNSLPLTVEQEYMWWRAHPEGLYNNTWRIWRIEGPLNLKVLQEAIKEIARRHTPLHTTLEKVDGSVVQVVRPEMEPAFEVVDCPNIPENEESQVIRNYLEECSLRQFDLVNGPMLRVNILRLSETSHILMPCINHATTDASSWGLFIHELNALYSAFASGQPSPLPPLAMTFTDYAQWYQQWLQAGTLDKCLNYWRKTLAGAELLELPTDRPLPANPTFRQGSEPLKISADLKSSLENISKKAGVVLYVTLLSAYGVVLGSVANQEDFAIDSIFVNRLRKEAQSLIGPFGNILPLRLDLKGDPTFAELLDRIQQTVRNGYAHNSLPFLQLVDIWKAQGKQFKYPTSVGFNVINATNSEQLELPEMEVSFIGMKKKAVVRNLHLRMLAKDGGYSADFRYITDILDGTTVARIARKYHFLLETVVKEPQKPLSQLRVMLDRVE
ncbi:condensation domain-containing protein [Moorena producens]|uniref:condensation domain-containing protein n=1 Tax=Moorena producens TaxID=1155739 RepID=UPI003C776614